jgi:hypothetical protein
MAALARLFVNYIEIVTSHEGQRQTPAPGKFKIPAVATPVLQTALKIRTQSELRTDGGNAN